MAPEAPVGHGRLMSRTTIDGAVLATLLGAFLVATGSLPSLGPWGLDAASYWLVDSAHAYEGTWGTAGNFIYAPPLALLATPLGSVPWPVFLAAWTILLASVLVILVPGSAAFLFLLPPVALEIYYGNIHLLMALMVVLGFRWPATWAFVLLTKVTPGVGLAWFVARRDWRSLGVAMGVTALLAGASFLVAPDLWRQWLEQLASPSVVTPTWLAAVLGPLWLRVPIAAAIAYLGGLAGWRWPVAVATMLPVPSLWTGSLSLLVALLPLIAMDRRDPLPHRWPPSLRHKFGILSRRSAL